MFNSDNNIYVQETEVKPNKYTLIVLSVALAAIVISWIINEVGIFRAPIGAMRVGTAFSAIFVAIPLVMLLVNRKNLANPKMKYIIMMSFIVFTFVNTTLITFHTTILLIFPISIAMLYRSKSLGIFAMAGSLFCTIVAPILGYVIGAWDVPFFQELILIATNGTAEIVNATPGINMVSIWKIVLYIVFPRIMLIGTYAVLMFYVIRLGEDHVENQIELNRISHVDALTNLYNNNYFKEVISSDMGFGQVGVVFFDVNDLKTLNDSQGHEAGNLVLSRCAESIIRICDFDQSAGFRLGGDEFLMLINNANEAKVLAMIDSWKKELDKINEENVKEYDGLVCSMAYGYKIGDFKDIDSIITEADSRMYECKKLMKSTK